MIQKLVFVVSFLFILIDFSAQVKINEYSASNSGATILDNQGGKSDWIELFNAGSGAVNVGGWTLSDDPVNPTKYALPSGTSIPANGFLRIWCSGKGNPANASGHIHTNFKLTQCIGDWIIVMNGSTIIDSVQLKRTQALHSRGRFPNGSAIWKLFTTLHLMQLIQVLLMMRMPLSQYWHQLQVFILVLKM